MIKKLYDFILFANIEVENYLLVKDLVVVHNRQMLKILSLIASFFFFLCNFIGIYVSTMVYKIPAYLFGGCMSFMIYILNNTIAKKSVLLTNILMYLFEIELLCFGIGLTLFSAPKQLTISLIALLMIVPLLFMDRPYRVNGIILIAIIIYMILAYHFKPKEILPLDYVDVIVFGSMGIILGTFMTKIKYERYIYVLDVEKQAQINKDRALKDALTGLYNRHAYNEMLKKYEHDSNDEIYEIWMFDINSLKEVNDNFGHDAGDELICGTANCIIDTFGEYGDIYRTGGDEFVVIVNNKESLNKDFYKEFNNCQNTWTGKYISKLSVSCGMADKSIIAKETITNSIKYAEKQMYDNKMEFYQNDIYIYIYS